MNITSQANDLVEQAARLLSDPIDLSDWRPPEVETSEQLDAAEQEERERRLKERIDRYLADRADRLLALRHIREAAHFRVERYTVEAQRWQTKARDQKGLAEYVEQLAMNVLVAERNACGLGPGEVHRVEFPNGVKMGIRVTKVVQVEDIDSLPSKFVRTKTTREADKVAIKKLLMDGEIVSGAKLGTNEHVDWGR